MRIPVKGLTYQDLREIARPSLAGQPEAIPDVLYDTQTYTDNATVQLTFFAAAVADQSLSNMQLGGQLQANEYFAIHYFTLDAFNDGADFVSTAAGGVEGHLNDIGLLVLQGRPRATLLMNNKPYGPWPLSAFHATGGPTGGMMGTFTAEENLQWANNGVFDGGLGIGGSIIIPPSTGFNVVVQWPAAVDLTDDYRLRLGLWGVRYRPVQ